MAAGGLSGVNRPFRVRFMYWTVVNIERRYLISMLTIPEAPAPLGPRTRARLGQANGIGSPRQPLVVEQEGKQLMVRLISEPGQTTLLLEERRTVVEPTILERFGLSRREVEVLGWVAEGKTNAEIGAILSARPRTVAKHLERIFQKLGVENRTAAATFVLNPPNRP